MYKFSKRFFDIFMSFFGIICLCPILLFIAILVKFTSPGKILYRGDRTGLFGKSFKILKFRTMVMNAEFGAGTTSRNDSRITYIGHFLRRYKLDELPQLFNVLFGDMSFVGPRPELKKYTSQYQGKEKLILSMRPGITDFSSVTFSNLNELIDDNDPDASFEEKVLPEKNRLRLQYVYECNFWLDIQLIFLTLLRIMGIK
jgi:lipopolysaccharide/colanic/teichoic acid biosynthesis glycosyltransferase